MCLANIETNEKISFVVDSNVDFNVKLMIPDSISAAEKFVELNPTCTIEVKLEKDFSQVRLNFNDLHKNSVAYGTTAFETSKDFEDWMHNMHVISGKKFSNLINTCFKEYYKEDGSIDTMAILPLQKALMV